MSALVLSPAEALEFLATWDASASLGSAECPLLTVDMRGLERSFCANNKDRSLMAAMVGQPFVIAGLVGEHLDVSLAPLADSFDFLLGENTGANAVVDVPHIDVAIDEVSACVTASPAASVALAQLLRMTHDAEVSTALHAESLTYATLQSGRTFQTWLNARQARAKPSPAPDVESPVLVERIESHLQITLNRPSRRNALNVAMRDHLAEALGLVAIDQTLDGAILRGAGTNFSAGGDLDEFGSTPSSAMGHHVRSVRSLPLMMHRLADRVRVHLHGECVGAGIELPAFADAVIATADATFTLPEIGFGLVPGAGGTVSVARRVGRHRMTWLALTGTTIDAPTALRWRLVDRIV